MTLMSVVFGICGVWDKYVYNGGVFDAAVNDCITDDDVDNVTDDEDDNDDGGNTDSNHDGDGVVDDDGDE